ncbi:MAG TPA: hypothetical protein VGI99_10410, partial [Gemmataceae bacterium]
MAHADLTVERSRRRVGMWLALREAVEALALWAFVWGTAVLAFRATSGAAATFLLWGIIGIPVALIIAWRLALRRVPSPAAVRALLDHRGRCGGLLMAGAECPLGEWQSRIPSVEPLAVRWNARRPLLAVGIGYLLLAFLLPARLDGAVDSERFDIGREADRLAEQVRVLKEEKVLDPERAETLTKKLDEVRAHACGKDPAKTLEALDHLQDVLRQAARQTAEAAARQANQLGRVEAAATAVGQLADHLDPKEQAARMKGVAELAKKTAAESEKLQESLDSKLAQALRDGQLSSEQLAELGKAAKAGTEGIRKMAKKLFDSGLIDSDQLKACEGGKCDGKGLADFLDKHRGKSLKAGLDEQRGRGGVTEDGPGITPLEFGDRSSDAGAKFRPEVLPPSARAALKESQRVGVSSAE